MYVDYTRPPIIDISLPPAIILPGHKLILLYAAVTLLDFTLLRRDHSLRSLISSKQVKIIMAIYHLIIPMIFISSYPPLNILYAAGPWLLAFYSSQMSADTLKLTNWVNAIIAITVEDSKGLEYTDEAIRMKGAAKAALGVFKLTFCRLLVDPLLPHHPEYALEYPWLHPYSMFYTILFGVKGYCYLGAVDIFMGLEQLVFKWNMITLFNYPILSSSPRDFWSRRWNKVIHNLLRDQVFNNHKKSEAAHEPLLKDNQTKTVRSPPVTRSASRKASAKGVITKDDTLSDNQQTDSPQQDTSSFWSTRRGAGLLAFIVSGVFHELIIMSICRKITLEHLSFFTLHGVICMIEVAIRQGALKQEPSGKTRIVFILLNLFVMSVTGRLFTGPLLRYDFF